MTSLLLQICAIDRCSTTLLHEYRHLSHANHRALLVRAAAATTRLRLLRRRASRAPVTLLQKRRKFHDFHSLQKLLQRRLEMASQQGIRRRSSAADRAPTELTIDTSAATSTTFAKTPDSHKPAEVEAERKTPEPEPAQQRRMESEMMPPPPPPPAAGIGSPSRQSRTTSPATRNANRLSLTLPIALPTSDPSRPTPTSAAISSVPPTPVESPAIGALSDANDFIIAIAAQERRVLELREELSRAESELLLLKKQWTAKDAVHKRRQDSLSEKAKASTPGVDDEPLSARHSIDADRRKSLLLNQNTPTQNRRRVIRGGHARTLSLLSPPKPEPGFSVLEDRDNEPLGLPPLPSLEKRAAQLTHPNLSKRASWQPRSQQNPSGMPQLMEDFKSGFRAFVEDIRQITVGEEPLQGNQTRPLAGNLLNGGPTKSQDAVEQETVRPRPAGRPRVSTVFDTPDQAASSPTPAPRPGDKPREKAKATKGKHFSWTPLGIDSLDDNDWTNWGSPSSVKSAKSARWSGSTINNEDAVTASPSPADKAGPTPPEEPASADAPLMSPKLEEILPNMVNRLTPSNLKRTANNLMTEWERSLATPETRDKENTV